MRPTPGVFVLLLLFAWNHETICQQDPTMVRLELMPNQAVQEKAVDSNSVFTCVPRGEGALNVKNIRWLSPSDQTVPAESDSRIYTEMEPNDRSLLLIIKNTMRNDGGKYKCIGDYEDRELSTEFVLKPYVDITWVDVPQLQHPVADSEDLIKCEVKADPPATINWSKDGHVYKPGERCKIESNGIRCFPILEADNGSYSCRAVVSATGRVEEKQISVEVHVRPAIEEAQEIYEAIEENAITLTCNARGKPLPSYTWLDRNEQTVKNKTGYVINVIDGIGTLTINKVSREDSGKITCVAKNVAGENTAEMKVQVIVKPKIVKFDSKTISEGQTVLLQCYVQAEPRPTMEFYKYGIDEPITIDSENKNVRIKVSTNEREQEGPSAVVLYTMEISNVQRTDDGDYRCLAKNTGGTVDAKAHLLVEYAPAFDNASNDVLSWINNSVKLSCHSTAIPNASISWFSENGIDLTNDPNVKTEGNHRTSILTVTPVDKDYFGRYQCKAKNKLGESSHWVTLTEALAPEGIMQVNFIHKTATTVTIGLHGPKNDGGFPVENFVVDYFKEGVDDVESNTKRRMWPIGTTYILEKLEPDTMYNFRFAAMNRVGIGPWTKTESHIMPKKSTPEEPKILNIENGFVTSSYPTTYDLEWEVPQDNGEKITSFEVVYYPVKKVGHVYEKDGTMVKEKIQHPGKTQFTISGLDAATSYKVEIRAYNEIGFSVPATMIFTTQDDYSQTSTATLVPITDGSVQPQLTMTNFPTEIIIVIAVVAMVLFIIAIDITCYVTNKCGILMCLCVHLCNKQVPNDKVKEAHMEEGKTKDSKDLRTEDGKHTIDDDEAKDATEETPMIDGKMEKEQEVKRNTAGNDVNMAKDSVV